MRVAFLGPQGTFTEAAMLEFARSGVIEPPEGIPVSSPAEAVAAVANGAVEYACVAIENSVDGPVTPTFDALSAHEDVQIFHEIDVDVAFAIMRRPDSGTSTFTTHPVAFQQVKAWLQAHFPEASFIPASSNAAAAEAVANGRADLAAAPLRAAELFGLEVIESQVADVAGARTRFVLVGKRAKPTPRTGQDRTSVAFTLPNVPGSLVRALGEFALRGVDLSRIESRPTRTGLGTYRFYADLIGHIDDLPVAESLRALYLHAEDLQYLGSWPSASPLPHDNSHLTRLAEADEYIEKLRKGIS
ncbi:prephenate dehydratase [Corynebacterium sp. H130]|uniref:prephenate dehydratase n=1 Tax=Corynebacterium sp. H130 TaxID=3133444 RepID=UPI00309CE809